MNYPVNQVCLLPIRNEIAEFVEVDEVVGEMLWIPQVHRPFPLPIVYVLICTNSDSRGSCGSRGSRQFSTWKWRL